MCAHPLTVVEGSGRHPHAPICPDGVEIAVNRAIGAGYRVGCKVRLGHVAGRIVGYNIGHYGRFSGARYPLLVKTQFGVAKCSLQEVAAA
ncbi:hypothetical protein [Thauera sp.]|uniref:hypothetical protein n=1 Tax=Thauera sp. TaxID=1905334 RepID=UPI0039E31EA5